MGVKSVTLGLGLLVLSSTAMAGSSYVRFVKSIDQRVISNPHPVNNKKRFEGCGPVAGAMVLGYWHTERNYQTMEARDSFNGNSHPSHTIRTFYRKAGTRSAPVKSKWIDGKKYPQSFTLGAGMMNGMRHFVKKANNRRGGKRKLKVDRMMETRTWKKRLSTMKKLLSRKNPVILLMKNIPACLNSKNNKSNGWHYVVAVGHNDSRKTIDILSGWRELDASESSGPGVHRRISNNRSNRGHVKCSYNEIKKSRPGLFWITQK